jgi:predicted nucleic acid-binding protein
MTVQIIPSAFFDTNVWLYGFITGQDAIKQQQAHALIQAVPTIFVSTQVINEVCTNMLRKAQRSEQDLRDLIDDFYDLYHVVEIDRAQLLYASRLRERYALSYWDGLIVASALQSATEVLYSEDMHDGLVIEQHLHIVNPFKKI